MMKNQAVGRVLIVDDEAIIRESLQQWLEMEGFQVFTAENGEKALQICKFETLDVGVFDIRMPGMDGITLLSHTRVACPELSVIMMTAFASIEDAVKCISEGAHDYIIKPFPPEKLSKSIRHIIESRLLQDAQRHMIAQKGTLERFFHESIPFLILGTAAAALSGASWINSSADDGEKEQNNSPLWLPLIDHAVGISQPAFQAELVEVDALVETALLLADLRADVQAHYHLHAAVEKSYRLNLPFVPTILGLQLYFSYLIQRYTLAPVLHLVLTGTKHRRIAVEIEILTPVTQEDLEILLSTGIVFHSAHSPIQFALFLLHQLGLSIVKSAHTGTGEKIMLLFPAPAGGA